MELQPASPKEVSVPRASPVLEGAGSDDGRVSRSPLAATCAPRAALGTGGKVWGLSWTGTQGTRRGGQQ